jgi:cell wall-associated NlpC family hydrolase
VIPAAAVIAQAREWVGVPFLHQGRTRIGADCLGFIAAMLAELGSRVALAHLPLNYSRDPQAQLLDSLTDLCRTIELEPAALVIFQFADAKFPSHAALYTGESIIHAFARVGRVVETSYGQPWPKLAHSIWALPLVVYR